MIRIITVTSFLFFMGFASLAQNNKGWVHLTLEIPSQVNPELIEVENLLTDPTFNASILLDAQIEGNQYGFEIPLVTNQEAQLNISWFVKDEFKATGMAYSIGIGDTLEIKLSLSEGAIPEFKGKHKASATAFYQYQKDYYAYIDKNFIENGLEDPIFKEDQTEKVIATLIERQNLLKSNFEGKKLNGLDQKRAVKNIAFYPAAQLMMYHLSKQNRVLDETSKTYVQSLELDSVDAMYASSYTNFLSIYNRYLTSGVVRYIPEKMLHLYKENVDNIPNDVRKQLDNILKKGHINQEDPAEMKFYYQTLKEHRALLVPLYFEKHGDEYLNFYTTMAASGTRDVLVAQYFNQVLKVFPADYIKLLYPAVQQLIANKNIQWRLLYEMEVFDRAQLD